MESKLNKSMKVKAMLDEGKSVTEIAEAVSCNKALVYMVRNKFYPELRRKYKTESGRKLKRSKTKPIKFLAATPNTMLNELRDKLPVKMRKAVAEIARKKLAELDKTNDAVNHPAHYTKGGIEVYDFIKAKALSYELGNVVKYVSRADHKGNKLQDLMKARWYIDAAIRAAGGAV